MLQIANGQTQQDTLQWLWTYQSTFEKAAKYLQERNIDSALYYADVSKKFAEKYIGKKAYGLYAQTIFFTSIAYQALHNFDMASEATNEYLTITAENTGKNNIEYLRGLMSLGNLYFIMHNYGKAEEVVKEAMNLCETLKGKENQEFIRLLKIYSQIYAALQDYPKAQILEKEALLIETKLAESNSDEKNNLISDLARIYKTEKDFKKADSLYNILLISTEKESGNKSHAYAMILEDLGNVYRESMDFEKAKQYYLQVAPILKENKNTQLDYAECTRTLGEIYLLQKNFLIAENYLLEAAEITRRFSNKTLEHELSLSSLQRFYRKTGNIEKAIFYTGLQIESWRQRWITSFTTFTEDEKENSLEREIGFLDYAFSVLYDYANNNLSKPLLSTLFNVNNDIDGLLLQNNSRITQFVQSAKDTWLLKLYNTWVNYKKEYSLALQIASDTSQNAIKELEEKLQQQEKKLLRYNPEMEKVLGFDTIAFDKISSHLQQGDALIKWVNFNYHNGETFTESIFYGAFIIVKGNTQPVFINVCEQTPLKDLLKSYYNSGDRGVKDRETNQAINDSLQFYLYDLLWKPLLPYLKNSTTIYLIPSGQIHRISFAALQKPNGKTLFETYNLHQFLNIREITNHAENKSHVTSAILFGGIDFNNQDLVKKTTDTFKNNKKTSLTFNDLPGTLNEVKTINNTLKASNWNVHVFTGSKASKLNFISTINSNSGIIHLATHGFYFSQKNKPTITRSSLNEKLKYTDKPLLRSGIVFSGVNKFWNNNYVTQTNNNGIVTAQEIATLDLSKNELIVLSACETALGDINSTEGVYGLQRGFKMAGINKMIMSLWPVPDKETAELMQNFYAGVAKGQSFYKSLVNARSIIKQKYKDPYKWAGFILIGE